MSDSLPPQTVKPPGTSAPQAQAVQGVTGGVPVPVSGSLNATTTGKATAAAPTYSEGTDNPLSLDLSGNIRTLATATTAAKATAADPSYGEGTTSPISQDLSGHLRVAIGSIALPANASQETGGHLASIDAKLPAALDGSGYLKVHEQGTANVALTTDSVGLAKEAGGHLASIDTKVVLPAALDGSGFLKVHEQGTVPVTGTFWQATQPVSGTVTANQGTAAALSGKWPVQITDGTNTMPAGDVASRAISVSLANATSYYATVETPSGTINGTTGSDGNAVFTILHTPTDSARVYVDGLRQYVGVHYTITGTTITFLAPYIPLTGANIYVDYTWGMAPVSFAQTMVVDLSGNVQPVGDVAARSIHTTIDNAPQIDTLTAAVAPSLGNGVLTALLSDTGGNLRTVDSEVARNRWTQEESRLLAREAEFISLRTRSADVRYGFTDRRGMTGQRGIR